MKQVVAPFPTRLNIPREFYNRSTLDIARDILGSQIVFNSKKGELSACIVEVEAYVGKDDPACHAARGKTGRNAIMFGKAGIAYIYFIYGMYHCFNIVTEEEGFPAALLIRGAEPVSGLEIMRKNSPGGKDTKLLAGPGKFCRSFGLTRRENGFDLTGDIVYLEKGEEVENIIATKRIGIKDGKELLWRFYDADSKSVSKLK